MSVPWYLMAKGKGGGGYKTASGPIVSVSDALAAPLRSLVANIEPVQDLHGYDNPWPAGGGKNLLKTSGLVEGTPSDTTFSNETKRTFTVGTFVAKLTNNNYYHAGQNVQFSVSENSIKVTSSARAYAISIPIVGLMIGETYTLSCTKTNASNNTASFYKQDGTFISNTPSLTICKFTVPEETYYTLLHFDPSEDDVEATFTDIQLEKGSVPSSYAPYSNICPISGWSECKVWLKPTYDPTAEPTATIQLGQTVYGGTLDVTNGVLTVDRAMVDLGTMNWYYREAFTGFSAPLTPEAKIAFTAICSAYPFVGAYNSTSDKTCGYIYEKQIFVKDYDYTDAVSFKTAMSGVQLVYELATPIEIPLTPTEISTLQGQNNLWADSGDVAIEYLSSGGANADLMKLAVAFMGKR